MRERRFGLRGSLQWIVCDHELQPLHRLQPALKRFPRLDEVTEGLVVAGLDSERGIVRGRVEEGRFSEVEQDYSMRWCQKILQGSTESQRNSSFILLFEWR